MFKKNNNIFSFSFFSFHEGLLLLFKRILKIHPHCSLLQNTKQTCEQMSLKARMVPIQLNVASEQLKVRKI